MSHPHHHQHKRKRRKKSQAETWLVKHLDYIVILLGVGNVLATLPQVIEIWINQEARGVSYISWAYYTVFSIVLLIYGIVHDEKPIIFTYAFSVLLFTLITIGAIIYQ